MPTTTVARRLPPSPLSPTHPRALSPSLLGTERYSSDRRAELFHPHDCERAKQSGAELKRTIAVPRALAHVMLK